MADTETIGANLLAALAGNFPLSSDLYDEALADHEVDLISSLNKDADDAQLCMLAHRGRVAMMVIDWDGTVFRNDDALQKVRTMWPDTLDANARVLVPIFCEHISRRNLGVAGIKWTAHEAN